MKLELPPLPESDYGLCFYDEGGCHPAHGTGYTADQMREYAALSASAERERCAQLCEGVREVAMCQPDGLKKFGAVAMATSCASVIRGKPKDLA